MQKATTTITSMVGSQKGAFDGLPPREHAETDRVLPGELRQATALGD
jgi:hypothetical protein